MHGSNKAKNHQTAKYDIHMLYQLAAFDLSSALFQRTKTNTSQHIDLAIYDVVLLLSNTNVTSYLRNGKPPKPHGNDHPHATNCYYQTLDGLLMIEQVI